MRRISYGFGTAEMLKQEKQRQEEARQEAAYWKAKYEQLRLRMGRMEKELERYRRKEQETA